jgi:hypothetical protein
MAEFMTNLWTNLTNSNIYKPWSIVDPVKGITSEGGFFDNTPLLDYLLNIMEGS